MRNKEIYLKAYFRKNLGDDMFVRCISQRYPKVSFKIHTFSGYAQPFKDLSNICNTNFAGRFVDRVFDKLAGIQPYKQHLEMAADAAVHIGGSIFIEPNNFTVPENYTVNPNLYIIGCNFGPYKTDAYRNFIFSRLQKARDVCFRDRYSYNEFSSLAHVRMAPDVLFGYRDYPALQKGTGVGISVISLHERPELKARASEYYDVMAQTVDGCMRKGLPVTLFSFCADEGDQRAIDEILHRSETQGAEICEYDGDIDFMLSKINGCEYIIASRFHAMVIGWCLSKKVFPVVYSDKQLHVMNDIGYEDGYWDLRKADSYNAARLMENTFKANYYDIKQYQVSSDRQFEKLDDYLADYVQVLKESK